MSWYHDCQDPEATKGNILCRLPAFDNQPAICSAFPWNRWACECWRESSVRKASGPQKHQGLSSEITVPPGELADTSTSASNPTMPNNRRLQTLLLSDAACWGLTRCAIYRHKQGAQSAIPIGDTTKVLAKHATQQPRSLQCGAAMQEVQLLPHVQRGEELGRRQPQQGPPGHERRCSPC